MIIFHAQFKILALRGNKYAFQQDAYHPPVYTLQADSPPPSKTDTAQADTPSIPYPLYTTPSSIRQPSVNRMTDRCKNITFPQLRLRAVMNVFCVIFDRLVLISDIAVITGDVPEVWLPEQSFQRLSDGSSTRYFIRWILRSPRHVRRKRFHLHPHSSEIFTCVRRES